MTSPSGPPLVTVILPTYNRRRFLPDALSSIRAQTWRHWHLVAVDDGSSDGSGELIAELTAGWSEPVTLVRQQNAGAYGARNTGLRHVRGSYVAFFDSDDLWLPHHLERCVEALERHPDVDWVYGSCRMVDETSGREIEPSSFRVQGRPRPFLQLRTEQRDALRVIDDPDALGCQIEHGLYCGLQNSVLRAALFNGREFWPEYLVVEDQLFVIRLLVEGRRFAYFDEPHVVYRMHDQNSSGSASGGAPERNLRIFGELVMGLERVATEVPLPADARRALRRRLARARFWGVGYSGHWLGGDRRAALAAYGAALREWPWDLGMWKTLVAAAVRPAPARSQADPRAGT